MSLVLALLALALGMLVAACGDDDSSSSSSGSTSGSSTTADTGKSYKIAYFSPVEANSYIQGIGAGIRETVARNGGDMTLFDSNGDPGQQVSQIQTAAASGDFDGFVIVPLGPAVVPAITQAVRRGLKVTCVVTICGDDPTATANLMPGVLTTQVAWSVAEESEQQARATAMACEGIDPCEVALVPGFLAAPLTPVRIDEFMKVIGRYPNVKVVTKDQSGEDNVATSLKVGSDLVTAYPDLDVVTCSGDQCAQGVEKALRKAGKLGDIKIIGGIGSEVGARRIADGTWFAGYAPEYPATYGSLATQALIDALNGDTVPEYIDGNAEIDGPRILTRENVADFRAEWSGN